MTKPRRLSLVPDVPPPPATETEALAAAREAYSEARLAQVALVSDLDLTRRLYQPGIRVNRSVLIGMRAQAREQLEHARAVEAALSRAITALEARP